MLDIIGIIFTLALLGFAPNVTDDPAKASHSWGFTVDGVRCAVWSYRGSVQIGTWSYRPAAGKETTP